MRAAILLAALSCLVLAPAAIARDRNVVAVPVSATTITLAPDKAYILFRTNKANTGIAALKPVFLRVPTSREVADYRVAKKAAYEKDLPRLSKTKEGPPSLEAYRFTYEGAANVFTVKVGEAIAETAEERTFLFQVPAGDYVLYGTLAGANLLAVCNCFGTIGFHAEAGIVTDLGTLLIRRSSETAPEPELAAETGFGTSIEHGTFMIAEAVRSTSVATSVPAMIPADKRRIADYRAVGPFLKPGATMINRLAPLQGALRYDDGKAIDEHTGLVWRGGWSGFGSRQGARWLLIQPWLLRLEP